MKRAIARMVRVRRLPRSATGTLAAAARRAYAAVRGQGAFPHLRHPRPGRAVLRHRRRAVRHPARTAVGGVRLGRDRVRVGAGPRAGPRPRPTGSSASARRSCSTASAASPCPTGGGRRVLSQAEVDPGQRLGRARPAAGARPAGRRLLCQSDWCSGSIIRWVFDGQGFSWAPIVYYVQFVSIWWAVFNLLPDPAARRRPRGRDAVRLRDRLQAVDRRRHRRRRSSPSGRAFIGLFGLHVLRPLRAT